MSVLIAVDYQHEALITTAAEDKLCDCPLTWLT